ncbi:MAG TPA: hypothetical protein VLE95_06805 [Chlamydiales bacterium]|nr:hypothetical protein [Chlamydiales bacterium]
MGIYTLTFLFFSAALFANGMEEMKLLKQQFSIENDILISATGVRYPRIQYESKLHEDLAYILKDPKQAQHIHKAYIRHILPVLLGPSHEMVHEAFSKGLLEVCILFNHPKFSPKDALMNALGHQGPLTAEWALEHEIDLFHFVTEASQPLYPEVKKQKHASTRIVILTTSASGGNHSVADALVSFLSENTNIEPILIDIETLAHQVEGMKLATGTHTFDMIYSSIFQKTDEFNVILDREDLDRMIHQYIPSTLLEKLKLHILELHPDLIISTRTYVADDVALASLGIPFRMIHTNFEVSLFLKTLYGRIPSEFIRFWMPSLKPSVFKSLFEWHHASHLYNENDDFDTLLQKISNLLHVPPNTLEKQFEEFGYAVRPEFYPIEDENRLAALRAKWKISAEEIPIFISMGKYGSGAIKWIFNTLRNSTTDLPLKYLFLCGKNHSLKSELETELSKMNSLADHFAVYGALSANEMNEIMNVSLLGISKTGSASSGEALVVHRHLLIMNYYLWETANADHLVKTGLATQYTETLPLMKQVEACLKKELFSRKAFNPFEDWQSHLTHHLKELFKR